MWGPADATEGLCDASGLAHTTEGLCDASAPAHATKGLSNASTLWVSQTLQSPLWVSQTPLRGWRYPTSSSWFQGLSGVQEGLVLILATESSDEGFEATA
ncbi:hypothetical protein ILYODFUR_016337 [Ilyodon furcidens]|uniref:Uncharacterized protein n=1 Tax=Ilyodon furcidens TaxID=33524 RepID=A0ABV0VEZ7_9TELE